ncbi:bifunctional phosphoserine phosphatase/homoserine phosphotransferase ThrH [candidate division KSB1 bacterium]|nr:bifunctional phosphoserine phosphatase/homoserine phosphotransferase ThrH [candidate division KSB1 bacterium]NIR70910.1 bifunctional phosphoserine phosphatase/homoserine phosphotransferase ThrH [candidate division KSB1 bacterium]NIS23082.1 bifunctional phosphoserine phosphatase/homoserine phosphotransferase ThrH [candidate division KSB1 bacterium]NIT69917.1 bifunctional phosphoserine phosphatase/homoserine phosphotransferase ThrH [candidate division KSB1 bacterium]NIU23583.1 bifunctional pho
MAKPLTVTLDLESVLIPEIWQAVAEATGLPDLAVTTCDIADYGNLMAMRITCLRENKIELLDISQTIQAIEPLPGAAKFLYWLRARTQAIIVSDTFYEFAVPLMMKLDYPSLFCNSLILDAHGYISDYRLRHKAGKRNAVENLQNMGFRVFAVGDSYNDLEMLNAADFGVLFRPAKSLVAECPKFQIFNEYSELKNCLSQILSGEKC